jgi:hypothetical protein
MIIKPTLGLQCLDLDFFIFYFLGVGCLLFQQKRLHILLEHSAHTFGSASSVNADDETHE